MSVIIEKENIDNLVDADLDARNRNWTKAEEHINDENNPHNVTKAQVGLSNVDNTSDNDKPISAEVQTALNLKADTTYVDLKTEKNNEKINDINKYLNTINPNLEDEFSINGYDSVDFPINASQASAKLNQKGLTVANSIQNGNFSEGTENWGAFRGSLSVVDGNLQATADGTSEYPQVNALNEIRVQENDVLFIRALVSVDSNDCDYIRFRLEQVSPAVYLGSETLLLNPIANKKYLLTTIITVPSTVTSLKAWFMHKYADISTANGKVMKINGSLGVTVINLSQYFTNPSTDIEVWKKVFPRYIPSELTSVDISGRYKSIGNNLFDGVPLERISIHTTLSQTTINSNYSVTFKTFSTNIISNLRIQIWKGNSYIATVNSHFNDIQDYDWDRLAIKANTTQEDPAFFVSDNTVRLIKKFKSVYILWVEDESTEQSTTISNIRIVDEIGYNQLFESYKDSDFFIKSDKKIGSVLNISDEENYNNGSYEIIQNTFERELQASDLSLDTTNTNVDIIKITKQANDIYFSDSINDLIHAQSYVAKDFIQKAFLDDVSNINTLANVEKIYLVVAKGTYATLQDAISDLVTVKHTKIRYQLAEPIITPLTTAGNLMSFSNGHTFKDFILPDVSIYNSNASITDDNFKIKSIVELIKIVNEQKIILDESLSVISQDGLTFTHPDLSNDDIVLFEYEFESETPSGEMTITFFDSRFEKSGVYGSLDSPTVTPITTVNVYEILQGVFTNDPIENFELTTVNSSEPALKYVGSLPKYFEVRGSNQVKCSFAGTNITVAIKKNGIVDERGNMTQYAKTANESYSFSAHSVIYLEPEDYIQIVVKADNTCNLTFEKLTITISKFFN